MDINNPKIMIRLPRINEGCKEPTKILDQLRFMNNRLYKHRKNKNKFIEIKNIYPNSKDSMTYMHKYRKRLGKLIN